MNKKQPRGCGGHAWWCYGTCRPVKVYVYGTHPVSEDTLYIIQLDDTEHEARESSLFDTEEEALQETIKRIDKQMAELQVSSSMLERHRANDVDRLTELQSKKQVDSWSTVTRPGAIISGSKVSKSNITVMGSGVLEIKDGATVSHLTIKEGGICKVRDGSLSLVDVYSGGHLEMHGGNLSACVVHSSSDVTFWSDAEGSDIDVKPQGKLFISDSAVVSGVLVENDSYMSVRGPEAKAANVTVWSDGKLYVSSGGTAEDCIVSSGGSICKDAPYSVTNLTIKRGGKDYEARI